MRVLLLAEDDELYADAAQPLREAGHEVVGCHEAGSTAGRWPCSGVEASCPLDTEGVDIAVAMQRDGSTVEAGVGCVVRQKVPLVIGGGTSLPTAPYAEAVVEGAGSELVEAVAGLEGAPLPGLSDTATTAVHALVDRLGLPGDVRAEVFRDRRALRVVVHGPAAFDASQRSSCGQAAFAAVRDAVPASAIDMINVGFTEAG